MKSWIGLGLALALGIVAGLLNWWILQGEISSRQFVRVREPVEAGRLITSENLEPIELRGDLDALAQAAVPFEERAALFDRPASRDLLKGDLLLWGDVLASPPTDLLAEPGEEALPVSLDGISVVPELLQVGQEVGFLISSPSPAPTEGGTPPGSGSGTGPEPSRIEYVGPFRILSVGQRLGPERPSARGARRSDERVITVAIRREGRSGADFLGDDSRKLVEAIDAMHARRGDGRRIVSILLQTSHRVTTKTDSGAAGTAG